MLESSSIAVQIWALTKAFARGIEVQTYQGRCRPILRPILLHLHIARAAILIPGCFRGCFLVEVIVEVTWNRGGWQKAQISVGKFMPPSQPKIRAPLPT